MKTIALFSCIVLSGAIPSSAESLSVIVRDPMGAVIPRAHVVIHWDPSGSNYLKDNIGIKADTTTTTDAKGELSVDLPPGFYDVFVASTAFSPYCEKIRLNSHKPRKLDVKLKVSPLTSSELD